MVTRRNRKVYQFSTPVPGAMTLHNRPYIGLHTWPIRKEYPISVHTAEGLMQFPGLLALPPRVKHIGQHCSTWYYFAAGDSVG
jgi:hypothetical protein